MRRKTLISVLLVVIAVLAGAFAVQYYTYTVTFAITRLLKADISYTIPETTGSTSGVYDPLEVADALDSVKAIKVFFVVPKGASGDAEDVLSNNYYRIMLAVWLDVDDDGVVETRDIDQDGTIEAGEVEQIVFVFVDLNGDNDFLDTDVSGTVWLDFDFDNVEESGEVISITGEAHVWYDLNLNSAYDTGELVALPTGVGRYEGYVLIKDVTTTLSVAASVDATSITVANAKGFNVGDTITIGTGATAETNTIASVDYTTNTITLTAGLTNAHSAGEPVTVTLVGSNKDIDQKTTYFTGAVDTASATVTMWVYAVEV